LETRKDLEKQEDGTGQSVSMNGKSDAVKKEEVSWGSVVVLKAG
jgi:hypothetical protein